MSGLAIINSKGMENIAFKLGYEFRRQKRSHKMYKNADGKLVTKPFHNEDLGRGLIRKIINDMGITVEQYDTLRK